MTSKERSRTQQAPNDDVERARRDYPVTLGAFNAARERKFRLLELGYQPLPVRHGLKFPGGISWSLAKGFICSRQMVEEYLPPKASQKALDRPKKIYCSTGIRCGLNAGGGVVAVDIDIRDLKIIDAIEEAAEAAGIPISQFARIGMAPKELWVYRTTESFPKIRTASFRPADEPDDTPPEKQVTHALECLAEGQQFVSHGLHLGAGQDYHWPEKDIVDARVEDLPLITRDQLVEIVHIAEKVMLEHGLVVRRGQVGAAGKRATRRTHGFVHDRTSRLYHGLSWLEILEGAAANDVHDRLLTVTASMVSFGHSDQEILDKVRPYLNRGQEPRSEEQILREMIEPAREKGFAFTRLDKALDPVLLAELGKALCAEACGDPAQLKAAIEAEVVARAEERAALRDEKRARLEDSAQTAVETVNALLRKIEAGDEGTDAVFNSDTLQQLVNIKTWHRESYHRLRAWIKRLKLGVTAVEQEMKRFAPASSAPTDTPEPALQHLDLRALERAAAAATAHTQADWLWPAPIDIARPGPGDCAPGALTPESFDTALGNALQAYAYCPTLDRFLDLAAFGNIVETEQKITPQALNRATLPLNSYLATVRCNRMFELLSAHADQIEEPVFRPKQPPGLFFENDRLKLNTCRLPTLPQTGGDASTIWALYEHLFPIPEERDWIILRDQHKLLNPDIGGPAVIFVAATLDGKPVEGTGRGSYGTLRRALFGHRNVKSLQLNDIQRALDGGWSEWLENTLIIDVSEVVTDRRAGSWKDPHKQMDALKSMIEPAPQFVQRRKKHKHSKDVLAHARWDLCTNHPDALPLGETSRRFGAVQNSVTPMSQDFAKKLHASLRNPSDIGAFKRELLSFQSKLGVSFDPFAPPPFTTAKAVMVETARSDLDEAFDEIFEALGKGPGLIAVEMVMLALTNPQNNYAYPTTYENVVRREFRKRCSSLKQAAHVPNAQLRPRQDSLACRVAIGENSLCGEGEHEMKKWQRRVETGRVTCRALKNREGWLKANYDAWSGALDESYAALAQESLIAIKPQVVESDGPAKTTLPVAFGKTRTEKEAPQ